MWIFFSLFSALSESFSSLFRKQATLGRKDYSLIPILSIFFALPITTVLAFNTWDRSSDFSSVWYYLLLSIILNIFAISLRYKALKIGDISELEPLTMLTPAIIAFTSYLFLNEKVPVIGLVGILCVSFGAIILTSSRYGITHTKSVENIVRNKSTRLMLVVVGIWSVTTVLDKVVTNELPIAVYVWILHLGIMLGLLIHFRPSIKQLRSLAKSKGIIILGIGITATIGLILQIYAVQGTYVSYAIAVKNLGILFTVILGSVVLKEKHFKKRFIGALIMLVGLFLLVTKF